LFNSLEVSKEAGSIKVVRKLLGIPVSNKQMHQNSFERFKKKSTMKTQSGGKHIIYYSVYAIDRQGNEVVLGEGFKGESEAKAAMRIIARELGLHQTSDRLSQNGDSLLAANVLAVDN
jgi:alanine dehydrogenase